ncbi:DNA cytosine methyltransferase [Parasedimentitalea maritima]|uniref:Cytosine-specific methyltransferase n=1 Tax=Parasedimentitalea maritima TaxID=2578117 RepID=A0A6A4RCZ1_9RHOB|nr:DNA cytosine methyltransferase [Zongyanglinia marina]KAE9627995.1 DNA (cytosine-5-)-methyltransferase [Zongyanglinia marina]
MKNHTAIDLFCGAGGLSEGLRQAGFKILAGNDIDPHAGATFKATHSEAQFLPGSIHELSANDFLKLTGLKKGELDCLAGGPPCQGYSVYNHQRGMHDERSHLFKEYLRIVEGLMPRWLVMENVTGIMSAGQGEAFQAVLAGIRNLGYEVEARILRAEDYGVPQERRRVVFMANRIGAPIVWPHKTHGEGLKPFTTIRDALGDLPPLKNGEDKGVTKYGSRVKSDYQREVRGTSKMVHNHSASKLGAINIQRMQHIPQGGSWRDIPFDLLPAGMKRAKRSDHTKRYGRMRWESQSCTVLTKCDIHWGAYIHPDQERSITVREAARIQSFPDWFHFEGPRTEQFVQVGNAVPPLLGKCIGEALQVADLLSVSEPERAFATG